VIDIETRVFKNMEHTVEELLQLVRGEQFEADSRVYTKVCPHGEYLPFLWNWMAD
jgi:hypothetical protein